MLAAQILDDLQISGLLHRPVVHGLNLLRHPRLREGERPLLSMTACSIG
jgi:hypothetical protein